VLSWPERCPLVLRSSLSRHIQVARVCEEAWALQETRIRRIFERKSHLFLADPPRHDDQIEWLALMQHHGAPTRLLDFTWSPYVAAFFALERASDDAAVWALNLPLLWDIHDRHRIDGVSVGTRTRATPEHSRSTICRTATRSCGRATPSACRNAWSRSRHVSRLEPPRHDGRGHPRRLPGHG